MRRDSAAEPIDLKGSIGFQPDAGAPPGMLVQWDLEGSSDRFLETEQPVRCKANQPIQSGSH